MVNVVIPMSGRGSRFEKAGFALPKPLIEVNGKPMIQVVVENLGVRGKYIFLVLKEHYEKYQLKYLLPLICGANPCEIVLVDQVTEGAACTVLLAEQLINDDQELLIANSDQHVVWDGEFFLRYMKNRVADGGIVTFLGTDPKWSFAQVEEGTGLITGVAEKNPISNHATVGIYYFNQGSRFVRGAQEMIAKNIRVNNEFYVCPVYNQLIAAGDKIYNYPIPKMSGLGTPEDLAKYLAI